MRRQTVGVAARRVETLRQTSRSALGLLEPQAGVNSDVSYGHMGRREVYSIQSHPPAASELFRHFSFRARFRVAEERLRA